MAIQSHFVVVIDQNGQANIDYEISINFDNGDVWNEETQQWSYRSEDEVATHYETAEKLLTTLVQQTWKEN